MKKVLCYLGIIVLFGLTILPPVLRMTLPDKDEKQEIEVTTKHQLLSCQNENYEIKTSYENGRIQMIVMKRLYVLESDLKEEVTPSELDKSFDILKEEETLIYNVLEDGEVIGIDFSIDNHEKLNLSNFNKSIDNQKVYYESQNLTCSITE